MKPSESRTVFFSTSPETLAFADSMGRRILAPGRIAVEVGDSSSAARHNFDIVLDDNSPWIIDSNSWAQELTAREKAGAEAKVFV